VGWREAVYRAERGVAIAGGHLPELARGIEHDGASREVEQVTDDVGLAFALAGGPYGDEALRAVEVDGGRGFIELAEEERGRVGLGREDAAGGKVFRFKPAAAVL